VASNKSDLTDTSRKWQDLSIAQKIVFIGKLIVFLCTFGFAYPNLMDTEEQ
jgi:hypothetical protein